MRLSSMYPATICRSTGTFSYWMAAHSSPTAEASAVPHSPSRSVSHRASRYSGSTFIINSQFSFSTVFLAILVKQKAGGFCKLPAGMALIHTFCAVCRRFTAY